MGLTLEQHELRPKKRVTEIRTEIGLFLQLTLFHITSYLTLDYIKLLISVEVLPVLSKKRHPDIISTSIPTAWSNKSTSLYINYLWLN